MKAKGNQVMGNLQFKKLDVTNRISEGKNTDTKNKQESKEVKFKQYSKKKKCGYHDGLMRITTIGSYV